MEKLTRIHGQVIPLDMINVDTDLIIPAQHLTSTTTEGYGDYLFYRLRKADPDFVFNQPQYRNANIIVAQENFGCGSSREHAVWALQQAGIHGIIAVSFADIFLNNAAKNGLLLITQPVEVINVFIQQAQTSTFKLTIEIAQQTIQTDTGQSYSFAIDQFAQHCLLNGLDELDYLLAYQDKINNFKRKQLEKNTCFLRYPK